MVRTHALHTPRFRFGKLDFTRISAEAGAIAINGAALLLLLAPLNMYVPPVLDKETIVFPTYPKKVDPPPPPVPTEHVVITPPRHASVTPTLPQQIETPQHPVFEDSQAGDIPADPEPIAKLEPGLGDSITQPLAGAHLEYLEAPAPRYPVEAIREALTGTVTLRVLVDVDGKPLDVQIEHSSGHRVLDAAARKQVLAKWRFKPATENGRAVQAIGLIPVVFNLNQ
ncbi:energy transducer TonB [Lysobacter terrae]